MPRLDLFLLGPPRLETGALIEVGRRKAIALMAYLAVTRQGYSRDALATLLWPDSTQSHARAALRRVLSDLNKALGNPWLDAAADVVGLRSDASIWVDVEAFHAIWQDCQIHSHPADEPCAVCVMLLTRAVALYRDDFLAGFTLPDAPLFDEWQFFEAEGLRRELASALERLVHYYTEQQDFEVAISYARRWAALDQLSESPQRALIHLYARMGQRTAALRQYQVYTHSLGKEMGIRPGKEIAALYECIRRGDAGQTGVGLSEVALLRPLAFIPIAPAKPPTYEVQVEEEIRLVTVLVTGLSRAASTSWDRPPEEIADSANLLHQAVTRVVSEYGARIDRFLGDSVQVVFGAAQVHEDDPERATRAASEIQATAQKLGLSVSTGISTGRVYFGRVGAADSQEMMAIGPVVNLAARLQEKATTGQTLVSAATYRYIQDTFDFIPLAVEIGGMDKPITVYQVTGALKRLEHVYTRDSLHTQLIGRDEELNQVKAALNAVLHGQGRVVSLIGEAGLGSSRLIEELKQAGLATKAGTRPLWLEGHCLEMHSATSLWPFIDILQTYLRHCHPEEPDHAARLVTTLTDMAQQGDLSQMHFEFELVAALLGNLLGISFGTDWDERLKNTGPEQMRHQTFLAIYDFFLALAQRQPLVLVFEELQWADDLSLGMLSLLLEALPTTPLLLLCAYRPEWRRRGWRLPEIASQKCPGHYAELRLRELTPIQSRRMVELMLQDGGDLPDALVELILERTRGNPFFLREAVRALIDSGAIYHADGHWHIGPEIGAVSVTESVESVILSQVDRLESDLKFVLRNAAVIGRRFPTEVLAQIVPANIDLKRALVSLEDATLIYQERIVPEVEYSFRHLLIQEAVYRTISRRQCARLHGQVADAMARRYSDRISEYYEQLAYHYNNSELIERAIEYLLKAGEKSRRAYLNDEAARYFRQALERLDELASGAATVSSAWVRWKLSALTGLGQIYHELGLEKAEEAEFHLRQAIAVGQEASIGARELVRLYYWLGEVMFWQERYEEQAHLGEAGLALLGKDETESVYAVLMNQTVAVAGDARGDRALFQALTERTAQFIQRLPYSEELGPAYFHILNLYLNEDVDETGRWLQIVEGLAEQHYDLRALAEVHDYRWLSSFQTGAIQSATSHFSRILELYAKIGDNSRVGRSLGNATWNDLLLGHLQEAQQHARRGLEIAQALGFDRFLSESYLNMGLVLLCQQLWQKAREALESALQYASKIGHHWAKWAATYCLGRIDLIEGKPQVALSHFQAALALLTPSVYMGWRLRGSSLLAGLLSGLEEAFRTREDFRAFCHSLDEQKMRSAKLPLPRQWCLEPTGAPACSPSLTESYTWDTLSESLDPDWNWQDPFSDCSFRVRNGLEIHAANGRDLWGMNRSSPRLVRPASGNFVLQTFCGPTRALRGDRAGASQDQKPSIGGLLLWKDDHNYLRLIWGGRGKREVSFEGCIQNEIVWVGRGLLPVRGDQEEWFGEETVGLRLERSGSQVRALCCFDGERWFSVGRAAFPVTDPVQAGVHAVGWIDRTIYPGAHPDGTAIHFKSLQMWEW